MQQGALQRFWAPSFLMATLWQVPFILLWIPTKQYYHNVLILLSKQHI